MQFERIRKNHKKEILIALITICAIGGILTFATSRAFYRVDDSIDLAKGTINYKAYDFKIMAMYKSDDKTNYIEIIDRMPGSGYVINEEKSYCNIDNKNRDTEAVLKTVDGNHIFNNLSKSDKCYLYFDKYEEKITIDNIIKTINAKNETPNFNQASTTDEGIYATTDGMYGGTSYYWRGAATTNYVKFAGFCWRIVRINGDKSIRLIYDGANCHTNGTNTSESIAKTNIAYNLSSKQSNYVGWTYEGTIQRPTDLTAATASNAKTQLESWYSTNITGTNTEKIAQGKYCNDRNIETGYTWAINGNSFNYAAYKRIRKDYTPTLNCPSNDVYTLSIGLITADEVMFAGGKDSANTSYFLYNGQSYWTMTPFFWTDGGDYFSGGPIVFHIASTGLLGSGYMTSSCVDDTNIGLRPVINLPANTTFQSGGDGTLNNPYVVE